MRTAYHDRLDEIIDGLSDMTRSVASAVARANVALLDADLELAESVIAHDQQIDAMREKLDDEISEVMALQAPVAGDLRLVVAMLRICGTLERMGDLAEHIARTARRRYPESAIPNELRGTILEMSQIAERIVQKAGSALEHRDTTLADEVESDDDRMDELHRRLFTILLDPSWKGGVEPAIDIVLISRYYERFADHAVSVARRVADQFPAPREDDGVDDEPSSDDGSS